MARQIIKGFTMLSLVVALAFVAAVTSAYGQTSRRQVATIPFEFAVGDKNLPAGEYAVGSITAGGEALLIKGTDQSNAAIRMTNRVNKLEPAETGKLVFRRYANNYFLTEVWVAGDSTGRSLVKSARQRAIEREMAANPSTREQASSRYEIVEIVALAR